MLLLIYLLIFGLMSCLDGKFRYDYKYYNDAEGYLKLHIVPANWHEARLRCHLEGAKLASPLNEKLKSAMKDVMKLENTSRVIFTGIHSTFSRGDFHSVEGIPLSKIPHNWADDEPDNYEDNESCLLMLPNGMLADFNCSEPLPYMCYKRSAKILHITVCGTIDPEYELYPKTGSCYKFHRVPRTWSRAYMTCTAEGGHLAIINSEDEAQVIKEIFAKNPGHTIKGNYLKDLAFIGFHDWGEHEEFLTIQGDTLLAAGYDRFSPGQPNNLTAGEFCGAVNRNGLFDDLWCEKKFAFICEKDAYSLLSESDDD